MIHKIRSFIAYARLCLFTTGIEREIFRRVAPHLRKERDNGYPFRSKEQLSKAAIEEGLETKSCLEMIERQADHMGKFYGEAFRYIMYRDLNKRLRFYAELAPWRVQPKTCDPRFVATHA